MDPHGKFLFWNHLNKHGIFKSQLPIIKALEFGQILLIFNKIKSFETNAVEIELIKNYKN